MTTSSCRHTTRAFLVPGLACIALLDSSEIWLCVSVSLWSSCSVRIVVESTRVVVFVRRIMLWSGYHERAGMPDDAQTVVGPVKSRR